MSEQNRAISYAVATFAEIDARRYAIVQDAARRLAEVGLDDARWQRSRRGAHPNAAIRAALENTRSAVASIENEATLLMQNGYRAKGV